MIKDYMELTDQQHVIVNAVRDTEQDMSVTAVAGAGKTTTLVAAAQAIPQTLVGYIVFNKNAQLEAVKKFPDNTEPRTLHSLAFREVGKNYRSRLENSGITTVEAAKILNFPESLHVDATRTWTQHALIAQTYATLGRWASSDSEELELWHVPADAAPDGDRSNAPLCALLLDAARIVQKDIYNTAGKFRFTHDYYLKMWALTQPRLPFDTVFVDESQDHTSLAAHVIRNGGARSVVVGDPYQQMYRWRGALDPRANFPDHKQYYLTQSFRFGCDIAEFANQFLILAGADTRVEGLNRRDTIGAISTPDAVLCRSNAGCLLAVLDAMRRKRRPYLQGGTREISSFIDGYEQLKKGKRPYHHFLGQFTSLSGLEEYLQDAKKTAQDMAAMSSAVKEYGIEPLRVIIAALDRIPLGAADVVISTVHKAKGLEWGKVTFQEDFINDSVRTEEHLLEHPEEINIRYVAVTRAQTHLDPTNVLPIKDVKAQASKGYSRQE